MIDLRVVGYVLGMLMAILGATMMVPMAVDLLLGTGHWPAFLEAAAISVAIGGGMALSCANAPAGLSLQQVFLLTTSVWLVLPVIGALPFIFGATEARVVDAYFEAMSGLTTTGSTVFTGLDDLPAGLLLWRGMLQWFGGVGIIVVAMVFLPALGTGGMSLFKSEGFDTEGKILPKAGQIASQISVIYVGLTIACGLIYLGLGMGALDAVVHAMTTLSTGGFANYDSSFGDFSAATHYVCAVFMILAALPFVRYIQLVAGSPRRLLRDPQIRTFMQVILVLVVILTLWQWQRSGGGEAAFREVVFNVVSVITGTGYSSADYMLWGSFAVTLLFFVGLIGGCAGSTSCSIKIFRYQLLFAALKTQIRRIHSPNGLFITRYAGRPVEDAIMSSVMSFFVLFILTLGVLAVLLGMTGLDMITSISGAATAIANIGPGLGDRIGPAGNFQDLNDTAKWLLSFGMLAGRLELMAVFAILTPQFWRL